MIGIAGTQSKSLYLIITRDHVGPGFDYDFDALNISGKPSLLGQAMNEVLSSGKAESTLAIAQTFLPILQYIVGTYIIPFDLPVLTQMAAYK